MQKMRSYICALFLVSLVGIAINCALADDVASTTQKPNVNVTKEKIFTYSGSLLPSDWTVVTVHNDRALIGFKNGSASNTLLTELSQKDRTFIERLQNGSFSTPLASAKEKLSQLTSSFSSGFNKLSHTLRGQLDGFFNKPKDVNGTTTVVNGTTIITSTN